MGARAAERTTVVYVPIDPMVGVPGYESWWDVAVAEVSEQDSVRTARRAVTRVAEVDAVIAGIRRDMMRP